ncbi:stage II sporulation protein M [bacterium]|nr:stage II sporulation protein M [bacterium]
MTRDEFVKSRQADWQRFEGMLHDTERKRIPKWTGDDSSEFSRLFRSICYDLSFASSQEWGTGISRYLNGLVARGHNSLYRSRPGSLKAATDFLLYEFPRLLRANRAYFYVALILSVLPGAICGFLVANDESMASRIMTGSQQAEYDYMYSEDRDEGRESFGTGMEGVMAGFYVRNNVGVAFRCFATGILCGVGTIFFLIFNSISIGSVTGYMIARGHSGKFFSFVISHGSFELTAIVISGAAGLVIGHALVHPGQLSRWDALRTRGMIAIKLALGAGAMLVVAAVIEGFWSPSGAPPALKFFIGTGFWVLVITWLTISGRGRLANEA